MHLHLHKLHCAQRLTVKLHVAGQMYISKIHAKDTRADEDTPVLLDISV